MDEEPEATDKEGNKKMSGSDETNFSKHYGCYTFLVETAKDGVFGTLDQVRLSPYVEILNYRAYVVSQNKIIQSNMNKKLK